MSAIPFITLLKNDPTVSGFVDDRIEPSILKQGIAYPAIYVSTEKMKKLACVIDSGVMTGTVEVGVYSNTISEVAEIVAAVRNVLDDYEGDVNTVGVNIMRGEEGGDLFDEQEKKHVKIIEYEAITQNK